MAPEANLEAVPDGISDQDGAQFAVRHATTHARGWARCEKRKEKGGTRKTPAALMVAGVR